MGVDIVAFKNVTLIEVCDSVYEYEDKYDDWNKYTRAYCNQDFPGRADPIVHNGVYSFESSENTYSSSYGSYNNWREELCKMALNVEPVAVWERPEVYQKMLAPFYELIDFSDCEGVIGSVWCAKLSSDFAHYQDMADKMPDWFRAGYSKLRKAFDIGSQNGFVSFS